MYKRKPIENPGVIRWRGFADENKAYMAVFIKGKRYVFSRQGDGWVSEVDMNDPDIKDAIKRPHSQIESVDPKDSYDTIEDLLLNTDVPDVVKVIENTNNVAWLVDAYDELSAKKQSTLASAAAERLKILGVGTDGMPIGAARPTKDDTAGDLDEQTDAETQAVAEPKQTKKGKAGPGKESEKFVL